MLRMLLVDFSLETLLAIALLIPALLISLSTHEWAHAFAAYKQGDSFAKYQGRMTLNPMRHLDPIGFIALLVVGFGWAKPVPIVPGNFRHGKRSTLIVSLAGITANLFLAFFGLNILYLLVYILQIPVEVGTGVSYALFLFFQYFVTINLALCVFNLIPIPPLDGYRVLREFFYSWKYQRFFNTIERYGTFILILVVLSGFSGGWISIASTGLFNGMTALLDLLYSAFI